MSMYKKLRRNFMVVSSLVLLLVIAIVTGVIYWITSGVVMSQTRVLAQLILDNGGDLPEASEFDASEETFLALNAESIHETRFFSAEAVDDTLELIAMHIVAISEEDALKLARRALDQHRSMGRLYIRGGRILHYSRRTDEAGKTLIVLMDSTSRYSLIRLILIYMLAVWLMVLILYVLIMGKFSLKLIAPFVENDERQKRFITNASHELKTPLAVISANTEMTELLGGKSKWTQSTRRQIARLQTLIEDLVVLSRLDEMKEADLTDVDVSAVVSETAELLRGVAEQAGRNFETDIAPDVHIRGDRRGLAQITSILIDNAVKYCDEGGDIRVALSYRARNRGAAIAVSNTYRDGENVDTSRFFERFYRQDESHNSETSGFGIGLSMAREIAERMKGRLKVTWRDGIITFTVEV